MSSVHLPYQLQVPATLESQLLDFRRRVWTIKLIEALGIAAFSIGLAYLCTFAIDRLWDTPAAVRATVLAAALAACLITPYYVHRWIWSQRRLEQLARLLSRKLPHIGDQLLGVIELAHSQSEQARSLTLCKAAIEQVAHDAAKRDFRAAAPNSYHRLWSVLSAAVFLIALALLGLLPSAAGNAWARFLLPFSSTPRYTFTAVQPLPDSIVVPHGEPFTVIAKLNADSRWHPRKAAPNSANNPQSPPRSTTTNTPSNFRRKSNPALYNFPSAIGPAAVLIDPQLRPELTSIVAQIKLPDYLGRPDPLKSDVRGGSISLVQGSRVSFTATANRPLSPPKSTASRRSSTAPSFPPPNPRSMLPSKLPSSGKTNSVWPAKTPSNSPSSLTKTNLPRFPSKTCRAKKLSSTANNFSSKSKLTTISASARSACPGNRCRHNRPKNPPQANHSSAPAATIKRRWNFPAPSAPKRSASNRSRSNSAFSRKIIFPTVSAFTRLPTPSTSSVLSSTPFG